MRVNINGVWKQDGDAAPTFKLSSSVAYGKVVTAFSNSSTRTTYYGIPILANVTVGQRYLAYGTKLQNYITGSNISSSSGYDSIDVPIPVFYEFQVTQEMITKGYFYVGSTMASGSAQNTTIIPTGITYIGSDAVVFLL